MTPLLFMTRARLRRDVPAASLRALLLPDDGQERAVSSHRLVWTLFADRAERDRDFLWREKEPGTYYLLSAREPVDPHRLFDLDPPKLFAPAFVQGDRLRFALRVNATISRRADKESRRGKPCDVVMDALWQNEVPRAERGTARTESLRHVARAWFESRAADAGFALPPEPKDDSDRGDEEWFDSIRVMGYDVWRIDRGKGRAPMRVGVLDVEGELVVCEPATFLARVARGFGRARAFGCGLMLIRRAR